MKPKAKWISAEIGRCADDKGWYWKVYRENTLFADTNHNEPFLVAFWNLLIFVLRANFKGGKQE